MRTRRPFADALTSNVNDNGLSRDIHGRYGSLHLLTSLRAACAGISISIRFILSFKSVPDMPRYLPYDITQSPVPCVQVGHAVFALEDSYLPARKEIGAVYFGQDNLRFLLHRDVLKVDVHDVLALVQKDSSKPGDPVRNSGHRVLEDVF